MNSKLAKYKNLKSISTKPKTDAMAMYAILSKARQFEAIEKVEITLPVRLAYENLIKEQFNKDEVMTIYTAIRICMNTCSDKDPVHKLCLEAKEIILNIFNQFFQQGISLKINAQDRDLILNVIEIYETIVDNVTPQQMLMLITKVEHQIRNETVI